MSCLHAYVRQTTSPSYVMFHYLPSFYIDTKNVDNFSKVSMQQSLVGSLRSLLPPYTSDFLAYHSIRSVLPLYFISVK